MMRASMCSPSVSSNNCQLNTMALALELELAIELPPTLTERLHPLPPYAYVYDSHLQNHTNVKYMISEELQESSRPHMHICDTVQLMGGWVLSWYMHGMSAVQHLTYQTLSSNNERLHTQAFLYFFFSRSQLDTHYVPNLAVHFVISYHKIHDINVMHDQVYLYLLSVTVYRPAMASACLSQLMAAAAVKLYRKLTTESLKIPFYSHFQIFSFYQGLQCCSLA